MQTRLILRYAYSSKGIDDYSHNFFNINKFSHICEKLYLKQNKITMGKDIMGAEIKGEMRRWEGLGRREE